MKCYCSHFNNQNYRTKAFTHDTQLFFSGLKGPSSGVIADHLNLSSLKSAENANFYSQCLACPFNMADSVEEKPQCLLILISSQGNKNRIILVFR